MIFIITACSTLTKEECTTLNWHDRGFEDAMDGKIKPLASKYQNDCSEHKLRINSTDYKNGYKIGLKKHCTSRNGWSRGNRGRSKHDLCEKISLEYKTSYDSAFLEFKKEESIKELRDQLIEDNGGKTCSFDSDCMIPDTCYYHFNKCNNSDIKCSSDSDCQETEGDCKSVSDRTKYFDSVSVDVCSEN